MLSIFITLFATCHSETNDNKIFYRMRNEQKENKRKQQCNNNTIHYGSHNHQRRAYNHIVNNTLIFEMISQYPTQHTNA